MQLYLPNVTVLSRRHDLPFMYTLYKQAQTCLRFHLQIFIITFPGGNLSNYHCYYYYFTASSFPFYLINFLANYFVDRLLERVCHLWCELTSESIFYDNRRTAISYCDCSPSTSLVKWCKVYQQATGPMVRSQYSARLHSRVQCILMVLSVVLVSGIIILSFEEDLFHEADVFQLRC
jgi:hypothetical protein